ncbi:MAG: primary-amine oxidase [Acidimicrobiales bacterium]
MANAAKSDRETLADHPLAALAAEEITRATEVVRGSGRVDANVVFAYVGLQEPPKEVVRGFRAGDPIDRHVRMVLVTGPQAAAIEVVVSVSNATIVEWIEIPDVRPALLFTESVNAVTALKADPRWQAAMRRRGIDDFSKVQIDPWPAGSFGLDMEEDRRLSRCLSYFRDVPDANGYARPVEGVVGFIDMGRCVVLEVTDTGTIPVPPGRGGYLPDDVGELRDDLLPLEIHQPRGPSFSVDGNCVRWQRWSFRVSMDPLEGIVLHRVTYDDLGRARPIVYRASIDEMVVPYGSSDPQHAWKSAFDAGEWGLGRMANSLTLGCDCLGEIYYFDVPYADERGNAHTRHNAICMHEEDYGILWKHTDGYTNSSEVRRSRRLVVSSISTVGNYDYGFYWYFYLDGTIQLEVKLTGILSTQAIPADQAVAHATQVAPQLAAPNHQHLFNARLDVEVDGPENCVFEVDVVSDAPGKDNPWGNAFHATPTLLDTEMRARRVVDPSKSRHWKVVNRKATNALGQNPAYKLVPGSSPTLLAQPGSSIAERAGFATKNLWVTPYTSSERRAAGDFPNQNVGGDGLPRWTERDRPLVDRDVVLWHTFGVTHIPRPEDWPVMPVEYTGFSLVPSGFFNQNPALDVPPSKSGSCSAGEDAS